MNYYKFNIGDYAAATRHLTMLEHGAYRLLLDLYYTSEQPIPLDLKAAARKAGARSKDEILAVETVLQEFFLETQSGWKHSRCETEIADYQRKAETNREIGKRGGRPKKETQTVSDGFPEKTQTVSDGFPEKTLTINQEPITNTPSDEGVSRTPEAEACLAMKAAGMAAVNPSHPKLAALLDAGITLPELSAAAAEATEKGKPFAYALALAEGRRRDAATAPLPPPFPAAQSAAHTRPSPASFAAQDRETGMRRWEEMTGRVHPDRAAQQGLACGMGNVIDVTPPLQVVQPLLGETA